MIFWASAEVFIAAQGALDRARRCVEPFLNAAFAGSSLNSIEAEIRYIPIVMPPGMRERYPARSKLRRKQRLYDCAPQLDYAIFIDGAFEDQLKEYLRGIALSAPHLKGLGATEEQVEDFKAILDAAADRIIVDRLDQSRH